MKTIFVNGRVYTGELPLAEAFAVEDGRFCFAGEDRAARAMASEGDALVDLGGRFACAGFNDSHMHVLSYGHTLGAARLDAHTGSLTEMVEYLRRFAAEHPPRAGEWLTGRGWNQDLFSDCRRMPDRADLDRVSDRFPVAVTRCCGHCLAVNSRALELLGVTADTPQPEGGSIGMKDGAPDGLFFDSAMDPVYTAMPAPDLESVKDKIRAACRALNARGITSCQSDDYSTFANLPWRTVKRAFEELEAAGELTVRVYEQSNFANLEALRDFCEAGNCTGSGGERFRTGPLKLLGDGALGARTAFLSRPYCDDPSTRGLPLFSQADFDAMIGWAHAQGMQVAVHAIGDACLDRVLNAYERALVEHPRADHRHGIVHCQITRADQLERIAALGLHVYAQTIFLDYDSRIVAQRVGPELAATSYSWKALMDRGVSVSNGSDCPVEAPDPMRGVQCAVTRASLGGGEPYLPQQAFTVREALDSYTIRGAEASFEEGVKGRIRPGMLADFVVLDGDPFEANPEHLKDISVCETWLGGQKVFG